jgi:phosphoribosylglycinamide formyltransferase-1
VGAASAAISVIIVAVPQSLRIGVLASGAGTTLEAVIDAIDSGELPAAIAVVISNNSESGALARAARHSLPRAHLSSVTHASGRSLDSAIRDTLRAHEANLVLLAGYMKKVGSATLAAYAGRVINTHPALLPKHGGKNMYGRRVHEAVLKSGEKITGVSVHLVDRDYDTGRVLAQREVRVEPGDDVASLTARVQAVEREFLVEVLRQIATGALALESSAPSK